MTDRRLHEPGNRRFSVTRTVCWEPEGGSPKSIIVTFGFVDQRVRELFCADFKAGSPTQAIVMDACVLASRLLQDGLTADELASKLCEPPSLIGLLVREGAAVEREFADATVEDLAQRAPVSLRDTIRALIADTLRESHNG